MHFLFSHLFSFTLGLAGALAVAIVIGGLLIWWTFRLAHGRRRRRVPGRAICDPVVLVHGLMGFDQIGRGPFRQQYFRHIPQRLERMGVTVFRPRLAAASSVAHRAAMLVEAVRALPARRVNVIAHSMGGLDARYAVSSLGLSDRVASITTIGTPHLGTPIADLGTEVLGEKLGLRRVLSALGIELQVFYDLTTARLAEFNEKNKDVHGVFYASVVAAIDPKVRRVPAMLIPSHMFLRDRAGPNDGLVPASSQRWGEVLREVVADHWAEIGWSRHFDAAEFFAELVRELGNRGL